MKREHIGGGSSNIDPSWVIPNGDGISFGEDEEISQEEGWER